MSSAKIRRMDTARARVRAATVLLAAAICPPPCPAAPEPRCEWTPLPLRSAAQVAAGAPAGGGGARFTALAWSPEDPMLILAGTDRNGVWRSVDGGASFAPARGMELPGVQAIAFCPWDAARVYLCASAADQASYAAHRKEGLWVSEDHGASWRVLVSVPLDAGMFGGYLAFLDAGGRRTIACASHGRGLLLSHDDGESWDWSPVGRDGWVAGVAASGAALVAASGEGVFRSLDAGRTFHRIEALEGARFLHAAGSVLAVAQGPPRRVYLAWPERGVAFSDDDGATWTAPGRRTAVPRNLFETVYSGARDADRIFAVLRAGGKDFTRMPLFSLDGGLSWQEPDAIDAQGRFAGPVRFAPEAMGLHPRVAGTALAGIDRALMRTTDGGFTWSAWGAGISGWEVGGSCFAARHAENPQRFWLALGEAGLWETVSQGLSFSESMRTREACVAVVCHPDPGRATLFAWWEMHRVWTLRRSTDGGASWHTVLEKVSTRPTLFIHGLKPDTIHAGAFVSTDGGAHFVPAGGETLAIFERTGDVRYAIDPARPWNLTVVRDGVGTELGARLPGAPLCAAVSPTGPEDVFAGTPAGLFRHRDGRWEPCRGAPGDYDVFRDPVVTAVVIDRANPLRIAASIRDPWIRRGGILFSVDGGSSWRFDAVDFPVTGLTALADGEFLAATDAGLYRVRVR